MNNLLAHELRMLTDNELLDDLEWMNQYFRDCERTGDGINTKDSVRRNALLTVLLERGHQMSTLYDL
jgi:hypothetical protein